MHYTQKGKKLNKKAFLRNIFCFSLVLWSKLLKEWSAGELLPSSPQHSTAATHLYQLPSPWKMAMHRPGPLATSRFSRGSFSRSEIFLSCCMEHCKQHSATLQVILCSLQVFCIVLLQLESEFKHTHTHTNQPPTFPQFHFWKAKCQLTHHRTCLIMHDNKLAHVL